MGQVIVAGSPERGSSVTNACSNLCGALTSDSWLPRLARLFCIRQWDGETMLDRLRKTHAKAWFVPLVYAAAALTSGVTA